ncbi:AI-2E family transporter [Paenibacillus sp. ACRRX]|uniref:AI-2E family transporter n=1 Tax=unclassified Paenibacillus TaxID=185978 RepID=UPI001EF65F0B|nr:MULTISPECIES: AI-2E family transporter [unclassified Paenibacillus]MCG7410257.1 AI-2E family transporter [Paenibacillus sp. ACRRX]MDK8181086.1 AI-2E family transporter [Paenibacillus sp. UMB4589-SE434]
MFRNRRTLYYLGLFTIAVLLYKFIDNIDSVLHAIGSLFSMMTPFIIACFIAYLLRPLVNVLEARLLKKQKRKRLYSILIVYALFICFIILLITVVTPRVIESVSTLLAGLPTYISGTEVWLRSHVIEQEWFIKTGIDVQNGTYLSSLPSQISEFLKIILDNLMSSLYTLTTAVLNLVIGFIVSIYLLKDKEKLAEGSSKLIYALFRKEWADKFLYLVRRIDNVFSQYFVGVILDAIVVGTIVCIGLLLIGSPYTLLSSLIVAITNVIPYFGPFIGMIFVGLITLFVAPVKALWITLFILLVKQLDGYIIGPRIVGNKVGMGPIWIIFAIIIGGGFFGVIGMFIAVPIVAVIKTAIDSLIDTKLATR